MILIINFRGNPRRYEVTDVADAVAWFERVRDDGNFGEGFGANDMRTGCGDLFNDDGTRFGRVAYNGHVWDANDQPVEVSRAAP